MTTAVARPVGPRRPSTATAQLGRGASTTRAGRARVPTHDHVHGEAGRRLDPQRVERDLEPRSARPVRSRGPTARAKSDAGVGLEARPAPRAWSAPPRPGRGVVARDLQVGRPAAGLAPRLPRL